jgi:serine/threonine protein phosphatase PrpC
LATGQQNDPPVGRSGLWQRLFAARIQPKANTEPAVPGSSGDIHLHPELLSPLWDADRTADTADLTQSATPTEAMEPAPLDIPAIPLPTCPQCAATMQERETFCTDCGYVIPRDRAEPSKTTHARVEQAPRWHERYTPKQPLPSRPSVQRWLATARLTEEKSDVEVYFSLAKLEPQVEAEAPDDDMVNLQAPLQQLSNAAGLHSTIDTLHWPGAKWLYNLTNKLPEHLPTVLEYSEEDAEQILAIRPAKGQLLWDAWDLAASLADRFRWLREIAELLQQLHKHRVIMEALRPEMFVVTESGHIALTDLSELLPLPVPSSAQMKGSLSTAPELILAPELADAKVDLYPFGALVYALHHGRELTDLDFDAYGVPRSFVSIFPDGHPVFTQVVLKTFTRYVEARYPTQEDDTDPTGFTELIHQLQAGERSAGGLRLDTSGWSSTGLARATNEDAFALYHATGYEQDHWGDQSLILLADGMGGCNAGEVASALALGSIRETLSSKPHWSVFQKQTPSKPEPVDEKAILDDIHQAIQQANTAIHAAAEHGDGTQIGMGCTCEAAYIIQGQLFLAHVGDSRTYLYRDGSIRQLTVDQTLVTRLVAMGVINEDEAANHPRRHELDQALGSSHPVDVQLVNERLQVGDALIFCSDGLTTHVNDRSISEVLRNTQSAEAAARRLVNLANALGGSDNVTVVVVRVA